MSTTATPSPVPAMVVLVCVPLPATWTLGHIALGIERFDRGLATFVGFVSAMGYLATFFPALLLFEPFAVIATIWCTQRWVSRVDEPLGRVVACWAAVTVHTTVLAMYSGLGR